MVRLLGGRHLGGCPLSLIGGAPRSGSQWSANPCLKAPKTAPSTGVTAVAARSTRQIGMRRPVLTSHPRRWVGAWALLSCVACDYDRGDRWAPVLELAGPTECERGVTVCSGEQVQTCSSADGGLAWTVVDDCGERGLICSQELRRCATCEPGERSCDDGRPRTCNEEGSDWESEDPCDEGKGLACRAGVCRDLCRQAGRGRSNVGCEYWAVDLDNANVGASVNGAAQQFAVVVSNPHSDVAAHVTVELDDTLPGEDNDPTLLVTERISPRALHVFPLGPREVDGSLPGEFNTGTHTALTRAAYRVTSSVPVVAYQFNPLDNVNVFSNDASLLKPVEALSDEGSGLRPAYVTLGWPQTIAITDDPLTNFDAGEPTALRAFLTLVGTRPQTRVRVTPTARTLGAPGVAETLPGEALEMTLNPFDVLNLETDDFNADLTGSLIEADGPIVVFSGSEASDAPRFEDLTERQCCADHLEEQLDHRRTAGRRFVAPVSFNRSLAVKNAGGEIGVVSAAEVFRVIAATDAGARIQTTLTGNSREFDLEGLGDFREIQTSRDFLLESDAPVMLANITPSQGAAGVPRPLPGGDPSFLILPPIEQFRNNYVLLTPSYYAFDFLRIIAPRDAEIVIDERSIDELTEECSNLDPPGLRMTLDEEDQEEYTVYRCQLSFPIIDGSFDAEVSLKDGIQNDGVHTVESDHEIGVLVDGFDRNVSYSYAGGTELEQLVPR